MELDILKRVRKTSIVVGVPLAVIITTYWGLSIIGSLVQKVVTTESRSVAAIVTVVFIKFPVLYAAGLFLLWNGYLSVAGLVAGFTWPFLVLMMKGLGRYYLKLDETRRLTDNNAPADSEGKPLQA